MLRYWRRRLSSPDVEKCSDLGVKRKRKEKEPQSVNE